MPPTNLLRAKTFLFIDCQTTGMRPSSGSLLEFAWGFASADSEAFEIRASLIRLPEGAAIPPRVGEITGLKTSDLENARESEDVRAEFVQSIEAFTARTGERPVALIHYAQFEDAWLKDLLRDERLPFEILCTHRISKTLFPQVPSRNIRGLTGFFGMRIGEIKRAAQHVLATQKIWAGIVDALEEKNVLTIEGVRDFVSAKPTKKKRSEAAVKAPAYEYRVDRARRLAIPEAPGIYKMIAKSGEILYVGKATCLRDRVNSYFRGKKGRDPRKLELMAQVWDLETVECKSTVEAALVESDEIKRLNPPYNVSLKEGNRALVYYDRSLETESMRPSTAHPVGPFRPMNSIESLRVFSRGLREGFVANVFYRPIESDVLERGFALFKETYAAEWSPALSLRQHLAFGFKLWRRSAAALESAASGEIDDAPDDHLEDTPDDTPLDIMQKIEHLFVSSAQTYWRAKQLTRLLWADVHWIEKGEEKTLNVRGGRIGEDVPSAREPGAVRWSSLTIRDYDRMSVLLTEISKVDHQVISIDAV